MHHDVGRLSQYALGIARDSDAPGRVACADNFAKVMTHFRGVRIDGADDIYLFLFPQQLGDRGANGPDSILNRTNLLLHDGLRSVFAEKAQRGQSPGADLQAYWNLFVQAIARDRISCRFRKGNG